MENLNSRRSGQSLVEYFVLLGLVTIIAVTVVAGIGQSSKGRFALANESLDEAAVASRTSAPDGKAKPPVGGVVAKPPS
jgi:Flp pilus assembly pilin Flp